MKRIEALRPLSRELFVAAEESLDDDALARLAEAIDVVERGSGGFE